MQRFTGWEYLLIDLANAFGLDKEVFAKRIEWATAHLHELEALVNQADSKPLYMKAVMAIRKAQAGKPTGHLVGFDASCSGMQIMSVLTGCVAGATATGLVDPNVRADAYTQCTQIMNAILSLDGRSVSVSRKNAKQALMTSFYGSTAQPKKLFGEDTPELAAFNEAAYQLAPGAWGLLQVLINSWQSYALSHSWQLPDGYEAKVKVMAKIEGDKGRIEVDELDHATFTYEYYVNEGLPRGHHKAKSNAANVVHSIDAYLLRSIHRRCNYDEHTVRTALTLMQSEQRIRAGSPASDTDSISAVQKYYVDLWEKTQMADVVMLPSIAEFGAEYLPDALITKLVSICEEMLSYRPFEVVTIHDEFKCGANHMNHLRQQYINIMADMADSTLLDYILSTIHGQKGTYPKLTPDLSKLIKGSNYGLC